MFTGPGLKMTFNPLSAGGGLILNRQESIPTLNSSKSEAYVTPSLRIPKSTVFGKISHPRLSSRFLPFI